MTPWRPRQQICVKAIGLLWHGPRLLAAEVINEDGTLKGVRPLGGGVRFGETWQAALRREYREELGLEVRVTGAPIVLENIFDHAGAIGHEVVFAADIAVVSGTLPTHGAIPFHEADGSAWQARWFDFDALDGAGGVPLFPAGLKQALEARRS